VGQLQTPAGTTMTLSRRIELAFGDREKPSRVIQRTAPISCDEEEALWFTGRDWREISWEEWDQHSSAISTFTPDAFVYYLPSVLCLSAQYPDRWSSTASSLLASLDRSPTIEYWDGWLTSRLLGLKDAEYAVLEEWILTLCQNPTTYSSETLTRALDTVNLLQRETLRLRVAGGLSPTRT
jgi:hypothetical protein